ncbi:hypothetical protein COU20_02105 [Candidatus Kaiserbacteria bacterium CG10_big_fil_rev_8_21_14_0_10_59_10]|uniref:Uncharacterized protein n=1 Tax=Candidatus Kaiserbacteria bacterium CG10_big_fil_rev_8_21_14_0_10_59_10 TaxID=1974612 RepID=A0A2H0U9W0_9BACT|nr:MAG: hypothetical protein COU20_02105 [Candidatus Kaiserbacteria bacterium CG10_big_fil_rev_8_21_14_0_10_59_10]
MPPTAHVQKYGDAIARWGLFALALLLPVFFVPTASVLIPQAKMSFLLAVASVSLLAWFAARLFEGVIRLPRSVLFWVVAALPIAYAISALTTGWSASSVIGTGTERETLASMLAWYMVFVLAVVVLVDRRTFVRVLLRGIILGAAIVAVIQIIRFFAPSLTFGGVLPHMALTPVGSWHDLGIVLGLALLLSIAALGTGETFSRVWRGLFAGVAAISLALLLLVNATDVWFALAAAALIGAIIRYRAALLGGAARNAALKQAAPILVAAVVFSLFGFFGQQLYQYVPDRLQVTTFEVRPSWQGTYEVGQQSLSDYRSLLFGAGPNMFPREWSVHKPLSVNTTEFWGVDFESGVGVIPTAMITVGVLGMLAWLALCIAALFAVSRTLTDRRPLSPSRMLTFAFALASLYLLALHVVYVPGIAIVALLFLLLGAFVAMRHAESGREPIRAPLSTDSYAGIVRLIVALLMMLGIVFLLWSGLRVLTSNVYVNASILHYQRTGDIAAAADKVAQAVAVYPANARAHRAAVELGILELARIAAEGAADEDSHARLQASVARTIQHALSAVEINRADYQNWLTLARFYQELAGAGVEGAYEEARRAYEEAATENPTNPLPHLRLAQLEAIQGNADAAGEHLARALALKPNLAAAYYLRSHLHADAGRLSEAIQDAEAAATLVPNDPLGWYHLGALHHTQGNHEIAIVAFLEAIRLVPDYANALFLLALSFEQIGEYEGAIEALERVAASNPGSPVVEQKLAELRALAARGAELQEQEENAEN